MQIRRLGLEVTGKEKYRAWVADTTGRYNGKPNLAADGSPGCRRRFPRQLFSFLCRVRQGAPRQPDPVPIPYSFKEYASFPLWSEYVDTIFQIGISAMRTFPVEPVYFCKKSKTGKVMCGSWMWANLGGKPERTKELRSVAPTGFARAFNGTRL